MKKSLLIALSALFILFSCGPGKTVYTETKKTFRGEWVLQSISYPSHEGIYNVTLFNNAPAECFRQSIWTFGNNRGTYSLQGEECDPVMGFFNWEILNTQDSKGIYDFLLKPTTSTYNSTTGGEGFKLYVLSLSEKEMVWEQSVILEGREFVIRMKFTGL